MREHLSMEIRKAAREDAWAIADVHVRSWKSAYPGQLPQEYLDDLRPEDRVRHWKHVLKETSWPRAGILVLLDAGDLVGFSHLCPTRDDDRDPAITGEITSIYLAPQAWGGGNGLALMTASIEQLTDAGYLTATLWALDTNTRARRFYEIGGWIADGTTKQHDWGTFVCTDVRYVKDLVQDQSRSVGEVDDR